MAQRAGRLNILHVIDALDCGGAQRLLVNLAQWTPKDAYEMTICVLQTGLELKDQIERRGVPVLCFQRSRPSIFSPHRFLAYLIDSVRDLGRICRERNIDVIHCHLSDAEFLGILTGVLYHIHRIVTTVHYPDILPSRRSLDVRGFLRQLASRLIYNKWADYVVAVSEDVADQLRSLFAVPPRKLRVVLNGVDVEAFHGCFPTDAHRMALGLEEEDRVLTCVARLMPPKGHSFLLESVSLLRTSHPKIKLLLVGDGLLRDALLAQCESLYISDRVAFLGNRTDIPEILALTDVFVLPSLWEGTSLALLEAMAAGRPILATAIPGNQALLRHEHDAYLVPSGDPNALAQGIARLLDNQDLRKRLAENAYLSAKERFDIQQTIGRLSLLWR